MDSKPPGSWRNYIPTFAWSYSRFIRTKNTSIRLYARALQGTYSRVDQLRNWNWPLDRLLVVRLFSVPKYRARSSMNMLGAPALRARKQSSQAANDTHSHSPPQTRPSTRSHSSCV